MVNNLELRLYRKAYKPTKTIGELFCGISWYCYTLEDKVRLDGVKVMHETAIPAGKYDVIVDMSNRWAKLMPHILNVKGFKGIRIHSGNTESDTSGCILVGFDNMNNEGIQRSRDAYVGLFYKIQSCIKAGKKVTIQIFDL